MRKKLFLNFSPIVLSAISLAILLYCNIFNFLEKDSFNSLLEKKSIIEVYGIVVSNPSKTQSGNYYSVQLNCLSVKNSTSQTESSGIIQLLIPSYIVEALYPGKLYSSYKKEGLIIEKGLLITARVYYISAENEAIPLFIAEEVISSGWKSKLDNFRALCRLEFKRVLYAWGDAGGLLLALLSGSREYTDTDIALGFKNAGLSHILALSGMHLSLFSGLALTFGSLLGGKKIGTFFSLLAVLLFVWFAGLSPSLFRALLCTLISLFLQFSSLPGVSGNSEAVFRFISPSYSSIRLLRVLSFAFILHICISPSDVFTASFMLSYGALIGIAISDVLIKPFFVKITPEWISSSLSASIGAQLFTAPITISLFGTLMPIGIIASLIVSPLALFFLVFGFISLCISLLFPFILYPIGDIINVLYWIIEVIVLWFAQFPPIQF